MLTIRSDQMRSLEAASKERFERGLVEHFREHLPDHYAALGPEGTREAIQYGVTRAAEYGIVTEGGVTVYVRLMFLFGRDYDADPALPWAGAILRDPAIADEATRVSRLASAAMEHLQALAGAEAP